MWSRTADKGFGEGANIPYLQKLNTLRDVANSLDLPKSCVLGW